jgi:predicted amidohydrolase YtcJ
MIGGCTGATDVELDVEKTVVFYNANILTLDPDFPKADTMVIRAGKIAKIGRFDEIGVDVSQHESYDLFGETILPGFIDSHVHVRELGMDKIKADLVGVKTVQDIVARLRTHAPAPVSGRWIIGQGWDEGYFASFGYPDRALLDAAFPDNPVHLESLHGFGGFYNGAALEIAGIDVDTPAPEVGDILRRPNGEPTGVMLTLAQDLVNRHIPPPDATRVQKAIKSGLMEMAAAGVTSVHEAGMSGDDVAAFKVLRAQNELPIRVYGMLDGNDEELMSTWFESGPLDDVEDFLDIRGIKVFYDGSLGSRTALMKDPYSDKPDSARPTERISPADVKSLADRAVQNGFQMAVHAIGDEGNDRTLSIFETALEAAPTWDHRWRIEHAQVVLPDFYNRMSELGAIASMQSSHAVGDSAWAEDRVGENRIKNAYAWQRILGAGGHLMINSDLPGEPWTPAQTLYFAVTRKHLDNAEKPGWYEDQALSVDQALAAMTPASAYGAFQDDMLGSLEPGKWADFVVLDRDPRTIPADDLKNIKLMSTWVAGKQVFGVNNEN